MPTDFDKMFAEPSPLERALSDRSTILRRVSPANLARLHLLPEEAELVSRVVRPISIAELLRIAGIAEADAMLLLMNVLEKGALLPPGVEDPPEPPPEAPRKAPPAAPPIAPADQRCRCRSSKHAHAAGSCSETGRQDESICDACRAAIARALPERSTLLRRAAAANLVKLDLLPEEGYLVSRVDHTMSVAELLRVAGVSESAAILLVVSALEKGALVLPGADGGEEAGAPSTRPPVSEAGFDAKDLNEDVDLDLDRKKQILFLTNRKETISYYRLLGVTPNASDAEIRAAFIEKSRQFHPDTYFRKRLGSYKDRLDSLFQRVKEAYDTLMDPALRTKYEWEARRFFTPEEMSALVQREIDAIEDVRRRTSRRGALLRSRGFAKLTQSRQLMAEGDALVAKGSAQDAIRKYQAAADLDPKLEEARTKIVDARKAAVAERVTMALKESKRMEEEGNMERAVALVRSALELDSMSARSSIALAGLLLRTGGELKEARAHVQRAMTLGEKSGAIRLLHGEVLLKMGQKKTARLEFEAAAELGEATRAAALLKEC